MWLRSWAIRCGTGVRSQHVSQEGHAFLRGGPDLVRAAGQEGELPGGAVSGLRHRARAGPAGSAVVSAQGLARDRQRRAACHVPEAVKFQERWRMALDMLDAHCRTIPHRWVLADDEFGRTQAFARGCGSVRKPTCWMCPVRRWCAIWRPRARHAGQCEEPPPRGAVPQRPGLGRRPGASEVA